MKIRCGHQGSEKFLVQSIALSKVHPTDAVKADLACIDWPVSFAQRRQMVAANAAQLHVYGRVRAAAINR
jgi:hypothetical protein